MDRRWSAQARVVLAADLLGNIGTGLVGFTAIYLDRLSFRPE